MTIAAELGQVSLCGSARKLMGYCGAVPSEDSSGKRIRRGGITKTGNAHLRRIVGEAACPFACRREVRQLLQSTDEFKPMHVSRMIDAWNRALAIRTKPLARQGMPLWHLDRLFDT